MVKQLGKLLLIGMLVGTIYKNRYSLLSLGILLWIAKKAFGDIDWSDLQKWIKIETPSP